MLQQNQALAELFVDGLRDIYSAEKQILKALPKLSRAAQSDGLRQAFETHREETEGQVERLEQVFEMVRRRPGGMMCEAMAAILEEGSEMMEEFRDSDVLDTALVSSSRAVEHYEISRYGTLARLARDLDLDEAADLLEETLKEEEATDRKLGELAESKGRSAQPKGMMAAKSGAKTGSTSAMTGGTGKGQTGAGSQQNTAAKTPLAPGLTGASQPAPSSAQNRK